MGTMIIDGNNLVMRAFHAIYRTPEAQERADGDTIAESVLATIKSHRRAFGSSEAVMLACFDGHGATAIKRHIYPGYKEGRKEKVAAIDDAISYIRDQRHLLGSLRYDGVEADDLIGTAARILSEEEGREIMILTSDKDLYQCIAPNVTVRMVAASSRDWTDWDTARWESFHRYAPRLVADLKALMGDKSDCIPGVHMIGKAAAEELVSEIGTIEEIYANLWLVKRTAVKERLERGKEDALRYIKLTRIDRHCPALDGFRGYV